MTSLLRVRALIVSIAALAIAITFSPVSAQQPGIQTTKQDSDDYGAGGHREVDTSTAGGVLEGRVYDQKGKLREKETEEFFTTGNSTRKAGETLLYYDENGLADFGANYKFDPQGVLTSLDMAHYGLHGEPTWELTANYQFDGIRTQEWKAGTHSWTSEFTPYKPQTTQPGAPPAPRVTTLPTNTNVGVLFPRDFRPGDTITGSLWPAAYAEDFKVVPGLSEYSFPIQVYHLPDGSPEWSRLEIGLKGNGYFPVAPNGGFTVHIPLTWKGPLELQTRQPDPVAGAGPGRALIEIGDPVPAPEMPKNLLSPATRAQIQNGMTEDLIDLWSEAFDLENDLDDFYEHHGSDDQANAGEIEDDLDDVYDDIDSLTARLPKETVVKLAHDLATRTRQGNEALRKAGFGKELGETIRDGESWASFLEDEADHAQRLIVFGQFRSIDPFWTSPVLTQGKLGALRGMFSGDAGDTLFEIGDNEIQPLAESPRTVYIMPAPDLAPGLQNILIKSAGMPRTDLPVLNLSLKMSADRLDLRKGQTTTYHLELDGLNGLPSSAWRSSFFPLDLISQSELQGSQLGTTAPGASRSGSITLTITNESPGTISMQNVYRVLDAESFAPAGSYQTSGGVGAIKDGSFSILGVARAYLEPEVGLGLTIPPQTMPKSEAGSTAQPPVTSPQSTTPAPNGSTTPECPPPSTTPGSTGMTGPSTAIASTPGCTAPANTAPKDERAGNGGSIPVGDTAAIERKEKIDALMKRLREAMKKKSTAHAAARDRHEEEENAWDNAMDNLAKKNKATGAEYRDMDHPGVETGKTAHEAYWDALDRQRKAEEGYKAKSDIDRANPTPKSEEDREGAYMERERAEIGVNRVRRSLENSFSKEDRDKLKAARAAARSAEAEEAKADEELRAVEDDLWKTEFAPDKNQPNEEHIPIG